MAGLTEERVADLKEAFAMFDINGDGKSFSRFALPPPLRHCLSRIGLKRREFTNNGIWDNFLVNWKEYLRDFESMPI